MRQTHKISAIVVLAAIVGIITVGPAMADKDNAPGRDRIVICHFDKDDGEYEEKTIPRKAAERHLEKHENDVIPTENGCPVEDDSETEPEPDSGMNMDELMEELSNQQSVLDQITNSECAIGEVVTGFGPNGELICSPDNAGEENPYSIISRTDTFELAPNVDLLQAYSCEAGEIIVGGLIEMPSLSTPLFNEGEIRSSSEQVFSVRVFNDLSESVTVNVTWLCNGVI